MEVPVVKIQHSEYEAGRYIKSKTVTTANWEAIAWHLFETKAVHYANGDGFRELRMHLPTLNRLTESSTSHMYVKSRVQDTAATLGRRLLSIDRRAPDWIRFTTDPEEDNAMVYDAIVAIVNCIKLLREFHEKFVFRHSCPVNFVVSGPVGLTTLYNLSEQSYEIPALRIWRILEMQESPVVEGMLTEKDYRRMCAPSEYNCYLRSWLSFLRYIRSN